MNETDRPKQEEHEIINIISDLQGLAYMLEAVAGDYGLDTESDKPANGGGWRDLYDILKHTSTALKMDARRLDGVLASLSEA